MIKARKRPRILGAAPKINDQVLSNAQALTWRAAEQDAQSREFPDQVRAAARLRLLEAELRQGQLAAQVREGLDETLVLARARGEDVAIAASGTVRIQVRSRDGLEALARRGGITSTQFRAGMLYRDLYESADPERGLRSHMNTPAFREGGGRGGAAVGESWAERRLRRSAALAALEAKVRTADRNGRAVGALREIAGHARCLSDGARGGGAQSAYRQALSLALDVVAAHFRLGRA